MRNKAKSGKGRRPAPKTKSDKAKQYFEKKEKEDVRNSGNDPSWYGAEPSLLRDSSSIPFSWPTGATYTHDADEYNQHSCVAPYEHVPGIMSLVTVPSIGGSSSADDPINVAAQSVYSFVRHANSGHSNYDAPDLMLYILQMANCFSALVWCQRLYGYALTYNQVNRYLPNDLIRQNNVDPDDLRNNLANFRFWLNTLITKMASFAVPATMSIFSRMTFLFSEVYCEGTTLKDQMYQFVPDGFYKFGLDANQAGKLEWMPFDWSKLMTVSDIMTYVDTMFKSVWDQEDFGIMSGDILKAYGDNIIKLAPIPEAYFIAPRFDSMVLTQIKNARLFNGEVSDITQDAHGVLKQTIAQHTYISTDTDIGGSPLSSGDQAAMQAGQQSLVDDIVCLTVDTDNPTPEVVMEATRLMYGYDTYHGEMRVGSEFIKSVSMCHETGKDLHYHQIDAVKTNNRTVGFKYLEVKSNFHYAPKMTFWTDTSGGNYVIQQFFDLDNFAVLSNDDIMKMNLAAVMNMYAVPSVGKVL